MIWRLEYCNKYGDTARLDIQRGASTPIEVIEGADNPFSLKYKLDASNKTGYFMSSSAEISIFETATFNIDELKTSNETELKVNYYVNSDLKWTGFILPDFFSRVIGEPAIVEMTATDRLGTLKGVTLTGLTAKVTLRSLLEQSLLKTGISLPVQYDAQISESGTNVFDTEILSQRIVDTRGRNISCYDIIKSILVATNSTIRQRDGKWQIYNKLEHESVAPSITFNEVEKGARRTIQPVASSVGIFQELGGGQIYPDNYNFINGLSDWALGGSSPSFVPENRNVMGYTTGGMPIYGDSGFFSIRGYNSADPVLVTPETNPHIKSNPITIQTNDAASVKVNVDVNATGQNIATNIFTVIVFAEKVGEKLAIDQSGVFTKYSSDINKVGQFYHNVVIYDKGKKNIDAVTVNKQISGVLTADNVNDYKITVLITGTWLSAKTVFINSVATTFSSTVDTTKGNIFKTNQGANFTREHEIDTTIFGDYIARGINGYFYKYMPDDTSSLMLTDGSFTDLWTAFGSSEQLPLLQHMTRQKSKMFSIAHDILSATIEAQSFDPLAIYQSCDGEKWVIIEANYDFLRSNVDVVLEQIKYGALEKRDYIYSYFGDGESGVKSIGGISSGTGGGGSGGGMTADQVAILSEVQVLAHDHGNKEVLDQVTQDVVDNALREMIISTDTETGLTDENYLSSLRVLKEILDNNEYLRTQFLSKVNPDTAQEIIKFVKGIEIGTFTTGPLGAGAAIKMENGVSRMEVDQLDVRMRATFRELIIESLKHIGGQLILSPARMKCNKVVDGGTYYRCYFDTGDGKVSNEFVAGDQARCQVFTGSGVKMYWRLVTSVGTDWINLSKTDAISGSSIPEAGDDIVQLGNRSDATRQNAQILSTVGADAPSWKQYKGINSFSLEGKDTTVFSGTGNKIDGKTVFMSSGANVEDGINSKNSNYSSQPTSYRANDTWTLSADTTVNGIAYKSGEILTATQDSTTYNQAHWVKKVRYTDDSAVNNMEIGSRNLLLNSGVPVTNSDYPTKAYNLSPIGQTLVDGEDVTVVIKGSLGDGKNYFALYNSGGSVFAGAVIYPSEFIDGIAIKTFKWIRGTTPNTYIRVYPMPNTVIVDSTIEWIKLVRGNKTSRDWTEALEDAQARIESAKQEALTAAGNAQTTANSLKDFTDTAFRDGIIDRSESVAIEKYKNSLNESMSKAEASYNKVYLNTYLPEGTAKTSLLNAKVNLWGQRDTLLSAINTAISGGTTTPAQKTSVDNAFSTFNNLMTAFQNALEEANKSIQAKLDSISKGYVDELAAGGANLVQTLSAWTLGTGWQLISDTLVNTTSSTFNHCQSPNFNLVAGKRYVITALVEDIAGNGVIQIHTGATSRAYVVAKKGDNLFEFTAVATEAVHIRVYGNTTTIYKIKNIAVRNIGVQERIDISKLTAEQAQLAADGYMRARYVRDWVKGSSINNDNHWAEIKVVNKSGTNLAIGKIPSSNGSLTTPSNVTDNNLSTYSGIAGTIPATANYVQIDLGQIYYDIDYIQIWHYYLDGRTYYGTKTEISTDGVNWTPVFDSAKSGTYKETAAGNIISFRPNEVLAKVLKGAAVTDTFKTTINGGLISTVMILLRELNSIIETAGISGIQDDGYLPAYWSGGTYAEALSFGELMRAVDRGDNPIASATLNAKMSSIVMLHNGHAKVGELIVKSNGQIIVLDKATGKIKFIINSQNIPTVADLMSGTTFGESKTNPSASGITGVVTLQNTISVDKNNSTLSFAADISLTLRNYTKIADASMSVDLFKNGVLYLNLGSLSVVKLDEGTSPVIDSYSISKIISGIPIGTYSVKITVVASGDVRDYAGSISTSTLAWNFTQSGVRYFQLGLDGLMAFYSDNHLHYTETGGLDVRGATNMPGVLAAGSSTSGGAQTNVWGAKSSSDGVTTITSPSAGFRVPLSGLSHSNYVVQITPHTNTTFRVGTKTSTYFEVYGTGGFDYVVIGNNYA